MEPKASQAGKHLDQTANQRTYLAWYRTVLTFMLLGIGIQVFQIHLHKSTAIQPASFTLLILGVVTLVYAGRRARRQSRLLAEGKFEPNRLGPALIAGMLIVLVLVGSLLL